MNPRMEARSPCCRSAASRIGRAVGAALAIVALVVLPAAAIEASASAVKAAFLYRFGFFVEWPPTAFAASDSPINLCIVGADPFGSLIDDTVKGQKIGGRAVRVRRLSAITSKSGCHIVYFADDSDPRSAQALAALRGSGVLTVTDGHNGEAGGGIINFVIKDNHVRFDIDENAAATGGLVISSRLLNLALNVNPKR
jgi:YfiR/HmsC-like